MTEEEDLWQESTCESPSLFGGFVAAEEPGPEPGVATDRYEVASSPTNPVETVEVPDEPQYLSLFPDDDSRDDAALRPITNRADPVVIWISRFSDIAPPEVLEYFRRRWAQQQERPNSNNNVYYWEGNLDDLPSEDPHATWASALGRRLLRLLRDQGNQQC